MKISPVFATLGTVALVAFFGEMNQRGYYGSTFGYSGSGNDASMKYEKMSSGDLRRLAASGTWRPPRFLKIGRWPTVRSSSAPSARMVTDRMMGQNGLPARVAEAR